MSNNNGNNGGNSGDSSDTPEHLRAVDNKHISEEKTLDPAIAKIERMLFENASDNDLAKALKEIAESSDPKQVNPKLNDRDKKSREEDYLNCAQELRENWDKNKNNPKIQRQNLIKSLTAGGSISNSIHILLDRQFAKRLRIRENSLGNNEMTIKSRGNAIRFWLQTMGKRVGISKKILARYQAQLRMLTEKRVTKSKGGWGKNQ